MWLCFREGNDVERSSYVDGLTIAGWGALLMPLLTMWHEIGGHAAACAVQGGQVTTIGAFYVTCRGLLPEPAAFVAVAGVTMNVALAAIAYRWWKRAESDTTRLVLWLIWVSQALVAAGYVAFSGVTGGGDLGTASQGALKWFPTPFAWRAAEIGMGTLAYVMLVRAAIRNLGEMLGTGLTTGAARRRIAHVYYLTCGVGAVLVGLLNPQGLVVTVMSAAASTFGGLAGFISIGLATRAPDAPRDFVVVRNWTVIACGALVMASFAIILGPSVRPT